MGGDAAVGVLLVLIAAAAVSMSSSGGGLVGGATEGVGLMVGGRGRHVGV